MTKIWYCYSVKRNPEGFVCLGINEGIKLLHKLWGYYKKASFQFLTLNTLSKYAPLVQPINFQGYLESEEQKKCFSWEKNSFVATRKEFFVLELLQTLLPIQLKKLNRLRHYTYCIFKIHLKFSLIKVQHAIFWDTAITSLAVWKMLLYMSYGTNQSTSSIWGKISLHK